MTAARKVAQIAAIDFEPMTLEVDKMISPWVFRERAMATYAILAAASRLLNLGPADLATVLIDANEDPFAVVQDIRTAKVWLEGFAQVLGCAEARALVALAKRAQQQ